MTENEIHDLKTELEQIKVHLEIIIDALHSAIEKGNDIHLRIVLGQSIKRLEDIAYR